MLYKALYIIYYGTQDPLDNYFLLLDIMIGKAPIIETLKAKNLTIKFIADLSLNMLDASDPLPYFTFDTKHT